MSESTELPIGAIDILARLHQIPFFAGLSKTALHELVAQCRTHRCHAAQIVFREGETGDSMYVVLDGQVEIIQAFESQALPLGVILPGDFFGEMVLFDNVPRSATARAGGESLLLEIRQTTFHTLLHTYPQIADDALRVLSARLREANTRRLATLVRQNQALELANRQLQASYNTTLEALSVALDLRDRATQGHSQRVATYSLLIAQELGVPLTENESLRLGALLHDIGKIGVSDTILHKTTKLTPEEWYEMRKHPEMGAAVIEKIEFLNSARDIVIAHHEKFDGTGYPYGLRGNEIPLAARIFSIADVFDAVTTFRPYRVPMSPHDAAEMIRAQAGTAFDPEIIPAFDRALPQMIQILHASFLE